MDAELVEEIRVALRAAYLVAKGNLSNRDRYEAMGLVERAMRKLPQS